MKTIASISILQYENNIPLHTTEEIIESLNVRFLKIKDRNPLGYMDQFEQQLDLIMVDIAQEKKARIREQVEENGKTNYIFDFT